MSKAIKCLNCDTQWMPGWSTAEIMVFGCGNILFGDDGFGPAVADALNGGAYDIPETVAVVRADTSVRSLLFNVIISEKKPRKIIVIDAIDAGKNKKPGDVFRIDADELPDIKIDDFSMHQIPTSNMLKELKHLCNIAVIVVAHVAHIPDEVSPGLSSALTAAIPRACDEVMKEIIETR